MFTTLLTVSAFILFSNAQDDIILAAEYNSCPPHVIDVTQYQSESQNKDIAVVCRVDSSQIPVILWFKQTDTSNYDLEYFGKFYNRMNFTQSGHRSSKEYNYVSKLKLHNVRVLDNGKYVCVAVSECGIDFKEFVIDISTDLNPRKQDTLLLLFLIPLPFALIPIMAWLCYYKKKNDSKKYLIVTERNGAPRTAENV